MKTILAMFVLTACGSDPISYSSPVTLSLRVDANDVQAGVGTDSKTMNAEVGNPYGVFITNAKAELNGANPGRIEVDSIRLFLGADSEGVSTLGGVFVGDVAVLFDFGSSSAPVASTPITSSTSSGPVDMPVTFTSTSLATADFEKLLAGQFDVTVRGTTAATFVNSARADLDVTILFQAFE